MCNEIYTTFLATNLFNENIKKTANRFMNFVDTFRNFKFSINYFKPVFRGYSIVDVRLGSKYWPSIPL